MPSNWNNLKAKLVATTDTSSSGGNSSNNKGKRRLTDDSSSSSNSSSDSKRTKRNDINDTLQSSCNTDSSDSSVNILSTIVSQIKCNMSKDMKAKYIGLDCEMVGTGAEGKVSELARCCLVDFDGNVVYDQLVKPSSFVTDFRTKWSGIRKKDLRADRTISLQQCQQEVSSLIKDKIVIGHALKNDLSVLMIKHSKTNIRDTSFYVPYMRPHPRKKGKFKSRSLKDITQQYLKASIQSGEHDPSEDARAAVMLYRLKRVDWEDELKKKRTSRKQPPAAATTTTSTTADATGTNSTSSSSVFLSRGKYWKSKMNSNTDIFAIDRAGDANAATGTTANGGKNKKRIRTIQEVERG